MLDPYFIRRAARKIAAKDAEWIAVLRDAGVRDAIAHDPALVEHVLQSPAAWRIREDRAHRERIGLQEHARSWFDDEELLQIVTVEVAVAHWGVEKVIETIGVQKLLEHLPPEKRLEKVSPSFLLRDLNPDRVLELLRPESVINHVKPFRLLEFLGAETLLKLQEPGQWLEFLGPDRLIKYLTADRIVAADAGKNVLNAIGMAAAVQHFGAEAMLRHIGPELAVRTHGVDSLLQRVNDRELFTRVQPKRFIAFHGLPAILDELPPNDKSLTQAIVTNPKLLDTVLSDPRTLEYIVSNNLLRKKLRLFDARLAADRLSYALPAAVVSFPRSGSNFLQAQLQRHTAFANVSLYGPLPEPEATVLTVKSHAPSPDYLRDECRRRLNGVAYPDRIVLLHRDPRDVMISFYEYTQHVRSIRISQEDFLDSDYFFASAIDRDLGRQVHPKPLSVLEAFQEFVHSWPGEVPTGCMVLEIRYEDLVSESADTFKKVFEFLEMEWDPAQLDLSRKVSLYDDSREQRGIANAWQFYGDRYRTLLDDVSRRLEPEIRAWGYEAKTEQKPQLRAAQQ